MPRVTAPPLPEHCPWGGFTPPNVDWCEEQLCSWVVNPADTWSNALYVVLGVWMCRRAMGAARAGRDLSGGLDLFGPTAIAVGVFSLVYHASYTYLLQFFDFVGMFLFCFAVITAAALRLGWISPERRMLCFLGGTLGLSALVPVISETAMPIQSMVGVLVAVILVQEALLFRRGGEQADYRFFGLALALLAAAGAASLADVTRSWCNPSNHLLQGHSLWHLLSACALYALFCFYDSIRPVAATRS